MKKKCSQLGGYKRITLQMKSLSNHIHFQSRREPEKLILLSFGTIKLKYHKNLSFYSNHYVNFGREILIKNIPINGDNNKRQINEIFCLWLDNKNCSTHFEVTIRGISIFTEFNWGGKLIRFRLYNEAKNNRKNREIYLDKTKAPQILFWLLKKRNNLSKILPT